MEHIEEVPASEEPGIPIEEHFRAGLDVPLVRKDVKTAEEKFLSATNRIQVILGGGDILAWVTANDGENPIAVREILKAEPWLVDLAHENAAKAAEVVRQKMMKH